MTTIIRGVTLLKQHIYADSRGELVALEQHRNLPFELKRVFFMKVDSPESVRGGHANSCEEFIVALSGSVRVEVDNGFEHARVHLAGHDKGLWIRAGILVHLREFEPGTLLLACASELYGDTRHFSRAQPQLIMADCPA